MYVFNFLEEQKMNYKRLSIAFVLFVATALIGCGSNNNQPIVVTAPQAAPTVNTVADAQPAPPPNNVPLDLQAVGELFRKAPNAQEFERMLNDPTNQINNLDRDGDGQVDYLQVQEWANGYGRGVKIYDIAVNPPVEVASIKVPNAINGYVNPQIVGGPVFYGANYIYTPQPYSLSEAIFLSWMLNPHPMYVSPYRYGYYAPYYRPYRAIPMTEYRTRTVTREVPRQGNNFSQQTRQSANQSPSAPAATRSYVPPVNTAPPANTERKFADRNPADRPSVSRGIANMASQPSSTQAPAPSVARPSAPQSIQKPSSYSPPPATRPSSPPSSSFRPAPSVARPSSSSSIPRGRK